MLLTGIEKEKVRDWKKCLYIYTRYLNKKRAEFGKAFRLSRLWVGKFEDLVFILKALYLDIQIPYFNDNTVQAIEPNVDEKEDIKWKKKERKEKGVWMTRQESMGKIWTPNFT